MNIPISLAHLASPPGPRPPTCHASRPPTPRVKTEWSFCSLPSDFAGCRRFHGRRSCRFRRCRFPRRVEIRCLCRLRLSTREGCGRGAGSARPRGAQNAQMVRKANLCIHANPLVAARADVLVNVVVVVGVVALVNVVVVVGVVALANVLVVVFVLAVNGDVDVDVVFVVVVDAFVGSACPRGRGVAAAQAFGVANL